MTDNKQYPAVTECVRAAGGRVHSDGNIFFKNADAFIAASNAMRAAQPHDHGPMAATIEEAARDVGKWLNERPNRPLDLRHVAMLVHHAQPNPDILDFRTLMEPETAAVAGPSWNYSKIESRIKQLMEGTAYPDSQSVAQAMKQLVNELHAEYGAAPTTQAPQPVEPVVSQGEPGWLSRLRAEQGELAARYTKLHDFRQSAAFRMLDGTDQGLMDRQENQMHALLQTLNQRINGASVRHLRSMSHD